MPARAGGRILRGNPGGDSSVPACVGSRGGVYASSGVDDRSPAWPGRPGPRPARSPRSPRPLPWSRALRRRRGRSPRPRSRWTRTHRWRSGSASAARSARPPVSGSCTGSGPTFARATDRVKAVCALPIPHCAQGFLVQADAGSGGGKLSLGVGARAHVDEEDFRGTVGVGLRAVARPHLGLSDRHRAGSHLPRARARPFRRPHQPDPRRAVARLGEHGLVRALQLGPRLRAVGRHARRGA